MAKPKEQLDQITGATGVAGGLHLFVPENEEAPATGGVPLYQVVDRALNNLHRDQLRASTLMSKLSDASGLHLRRDVGSLTILFRDPDDAEWVMHTLAKMREHS